MLISTARVTDAIAIETYIPLDPFDSIIDRIGLVPNETHYEKDSQIYGEHGSAYYV